MRGNTSAVSGVGISATATARGLDIRGHRARQLDADLVRRFDLVLVMEQGQADWIIRALPFSRGRMQRLGRWRDRDIEACLQDWLDRI